MKSPSSKTIPAGYTLVEVLVSLTITALLITAAAAAWTWSRRRGEISLSTTNLHHLATANIAYAADHAGYFRPAQEPRNLRRWHGSRKKDSKKLRPEGGFLTPYLGSERRLETCPLLKKSLEGTASFEDGAGGYGYNATYIGGTPADIYSPAAMADIPFPSRTVMFTTSRIFQRGGHSGIPLFRTLLRAHPQRRSLIRTTTQCPLSGRWQSARGMVRWPGDTGGAVYFPGNKFLRRQ